MSVVLPYNELHTQLTPEQNKAAIEKVAVIIKKHQLRSINDARHTNRRQNKRNRIRIEHG